MKTVFLHIVMIFSLMHASSQATIDYTQLIAKKSIDITGKDTSLMVVNIVPEKGKLIRFEVNGKIATGNVKMLSSTETVTFNLKTIFKNKKTAKGKILFSKDDALFAPFNFTAGTESIGETITGEIPKSVTLTYTGIAYWDALAVFQYIQSPGFNEKELLDYINNYNAVDYQSLEACKNGNEFFKLALDQLSPLKQKQPDTDNQKSKVDEIMDFQSSGGGGIIGSLSGLDVTQYVQAFADFLRDRIKEELTLAYINEFRAKIKNVKEFEYLLPKTVNVFNTGDMFSLPSMGPAYKAAFAEDMANLPENFERMVFSYDKYKDYRDREDFILFMAAYYAIKMSAEKYHPADILRFIDTKYGYKANGVIVNKVRVALSLIDVLSKNLKNVEDNSWIDKSKVSVFNPFVINVFLGLVYEQNKELLDVEFQVEGIKKTVRAVLKSQPAEKIFQFVTLANNIEQRINEYKEIIKEAIPAEQKRDAVIAYFLSNADDFFNLFDFGGSVISDYSNSTEFYKYKEIVKNTIAVAKGVKTNNVAQVGVNVIALIKQITNATNSDTTIQQLTNYVNFITDMVYADSSAKIKQVLQNYAAPPRSYRAIRQSSRTVSLASFPGLYVGYESTSAGDNISKNKGIFGITAPIGVSVAWGNNQKETNSYALFLSMVDIGAALTYRWNNDSIDLPQKVTLGQIFSPGLFGVLGFKNSPLALKAGAQYLPELRSIKNGNNTLEANAWHFNIALCVDIPVLILSRKK